LRRCNVGGGTLQQAPLRVKGQLAVRFSQSGKSPDLIGTCRHWRAAGALNRGAVNAPASPLAEACRVELPLLAGPETIRCRDKSYIAMCRCRRFVIANVQKDVELLAALKRCRIIARGRQARLVDAVDD